MSSYLRSNTVVEGVNDSLQKGNVQLLGEVQQHHGMVCCERCCHGSALISLLKCFTYRNCTMEKGASKTLQQYIQCLLMMSHSH